MLLSSALIAILGLAAAMLAGPGRDTTPQLVEADGRWSLPAGAAAGDLTSVTVDRVIDGDTLDVLSSLTAFRVRVFGIDAPEIGERCADEATDRLSALAADTVLLLPDDRLQDAYGRELRYLFTPAGDSIDAALVAEGYAFAWRKDGALRDTLMNLEDAARATAAGCLWSKG